MRPPVYAQLLAQGRACAIASVLGKDDDVRIRLAQRGRDRAAALPATMPDVQREELDVPSVLIPTSPPISRTCAACRPSCAPTNAMN